MRRRDLDALTSTTFDVLVVGGGIYGLTTAYEAASRGLKVALVEADDFAAATSFNHQRTAHGGLRALQNGRLDLARAAIHERRTLARIAPRLLRPMPFIVGTYRSLTRNRLALRAAFRIDRWLGRHRNDGVEPELHLPPPRLVSRAATLKLFPGIRQDGLTGGAMWYDYQIVLTNRLAMAFAAGADARGAILANYTEATGALKDGGRIAGMRVQDTLSGREFEVHAKVTVNAAGAAVGTVMQMFGVGHEVPLLKAMNLVTSKPASDIALASPLSTSTSPRRMLTLTPWQGRALIGTAQSADFKQPRDTAVTEPEVEAFIANANASFPALRLTRADVTLVHRGIVPAVRGRDGHAELLSEPRIFDHHRDGAAGAMTIVGVKFTTARGVASKAMNTLSRHGGGRGRSEITERAILPGAGIADHEALAIETARAVGLELAAPITRHLIDLYGDRCAPIVRLMADQTAWRMPLVPGRLSIGAEVIYAIRDEMAMTLADIVIRRTELGAKQYPGDALVEAAAVIAAEEFGWTADQRAREVGRVRDFYSR